MAMSSCEVVCRAIEFRRPDRLPLYFDALGSSDVRIVNCNQVRTGDRRLREATDEWGCVWVRSEVPNMGQVKGHPLLDWSALDHYRWPDPDDEAFYAGMEDLFTGYEDKYVMTGIFMLLFERMQALRGFENTLLDLTLERERVEALADRIVEFDLAVIRNIADRFPSRIHGFRFSDDWGTQQRLFVNPQLWNEFFRPRYQRVFAAAREAGWHVWMHSCGRINAIIEDLIEIGVDVLNLLQPRALGIEEIGQRFRGRVCFESICDIQHTLPFEGEAEIREEAQLLLDRWATPDGGFILSDYGDGTAIGISADKKEIVLDAFLKADPWKRKQ